jgi:hypothetical protein
MKEKILQMVDAYWKFDDNQHPTSSWHDKQDLLKALEELLQPDVIRRSEQLCQCKDKATKHFIKNWCEDCKKHIV